MGFKTELKFKDKRCGNCGQSGHTSFYCFKKKRKAIRVEAVKTTKKRLHTAADWYGANPSDSRGFWVCYLRIADNCPVQINKAQLTLEHVYPKVKYPKLKYKILNIKPSCEYCNKIKLSNTINQLCKFYPHLIAMIKTPEWQAWEDEMAILAAKIGVRLDRPDPHQLPVAYFPKEIQ